MLGHQSIKQTEEYALTEQATISKEMSILETKMCKRLQEEPSNALDLLKNIQRDIYALSSNAEDANSSRILNKLCKYQEKIEKIKQKII